MVKVQIRYNPYTIKTDIRINGNALDQKTSPLMYVDNKRLQEWIEPRGKWAGIYKELKNNTGDSQIEIEFTGTFEDYKDLVYAKEKYGSCFTQIELIHKNRESAGEIDPYQKLLKIRSLYRKLQDGPIDELKTADIKKNFDTAVDSQFRIVIVAPMSSGKSTLINAILGRDLLPALNQATTAVITEIKVNNQLDDFVVSAYDKHGRSICENQKATNKLIAELNDKKDPDDPEGKRALLSHIYMEGPVAVLPSDNLNTVFVDTPGGGYVLNSEHGEKMDEAINDENKSLILYVFNGTNLAVEDSNVILQKIANTMQNSVKGKQSRDRFLFVANQMDEFDPEKEPYEDVIENTILKQLELNGITDPNLFLISARTAKLVRMERNGERMSESDEEDLEHLVRRMNRPSRALSGYASLNLTDKEKLMQESKRCMAAAKKSGDNSEIRKNRLRIAEINSGVPAVELAIREYLEKYAVAIKIKRVHDTFMRKVHERRMLDNCEAEWAQSRERFEGVKKELQEKRSKCDHAEKMKEFRAKVEKIRLDTSPIEDERAKVIRDIDKLAENVKEKVRYDEAEYICRVFNYNLERMEETVTVKLENILNNEIRRACEGIVSEYRDYIEELELEGAFNIGGYNIKETAGFADFDLSKADDLLMEKYAVEEKVKVGSHMKKRKGFKGWLARAFGHKYGYVKVDDFEKQKFIKLRALIQDQIAQAKHTFNKNMKEVEESTRDEVENIKQITMKKLEDLDRLIRKLMEEIDQMLDSQRELEKKVENNKDRAQWLKNFVQEVEELLMI